MSTPGAVSPSRRRHLGSAWVVALAVVLGGCSAAPGTATAQTGTRPPAIPIAPAYATGAAALTEQVAGLGTTTRILMIGAHPDDEDTRLLTWLTRGQHVETAYLSLTRGDGGQNLIGNELGEALGVIRTEELLAARRIDGAHQYFTRAFDFGFSKSAAETFSHWPHDSVLGDVVTVVRAFRPHIIIAVFSGTPRDGHGHHQVSGILAREAYDVSGDTTRFPTATFGPAWRAAKFYRDRSYFGGGDSALAIDVGAYDPLLGVRYAEIAAASRSQHRSQGFGQLVGPAGPVTGYVYREATRVDAATPAGRERSMMDGIDTSWARLAPAIRDPAARAALDSLPGAIRRVQAQVRAAQTARSLAALGDVARLEGAIATRLAVPTEMAELTDGPGAPHGLGSAPREAPVLDPDVARTLQIARARVARAEVLAAGLEMHATVVHDVAAVDAARVPVAMSVDNRAQVGLRVDSLDWHTATDVGGGAGHASLERGVRRVVIAPDSMWRDTIGVQDTAVTQPWWLRTPRRGDLFTQPVSRVAEDERPLAAMADVGLRPAEPADAPAFVPQIPAVDRIADPSRGEVDRPLAFAPAIALTLDRTVEYVPARQHIDRTVRILLRSAADSAREVMVALQLPDGLTADSTSRRVTLGPYASRPVEFRVAGELPPGEATMAASATSNGRVYRLGYVPIEYEHSRPQKLYRPAELRLSVADVQVPPGLTVGYIPGVGDNVEPMLEQLGLHLTVLDPSTLASADLSRFTTIVVGPRAYEASPDLGANNGHLLDFARNGGTLVVQYGQFEMPQFTPFPITLTRPADRVTDENAPVRILDPAAPVLHQPNAIGPGDFAGWVQERSLYIQQTFDH